MFCISLFQYVSLLVFMLFLKSVKMASDEENLIYMCELGGMESDKWKEFWDEEEFDDIILLTIMECVWYYIDRWTCLHPKC